MRVPSSGRYHALWHQLKSIAIVLSAMGLVLAPSPDASAGRYDDFGLVSAARHVCDDVTGADAAALARIDEDFDARFSRETWLKGQKAKLDAELRERILTAYSKKQAAALEGLAAHLHWIGERSDSGVHERQRLFQLAERTVKKNIQTIQSYSLEQLIARFRGSRDYLGVPYELYQRRDELNLHIANEVRQHETKAAKQAFSDAKSCVARRKAELDEAAAATSDKWTADAEIVWYCVSNDPDSWNLLTDRSKRAPMKIDGNGESVVFNISGARQPMQARGNLRTATNSVVAQLSLGSGSTMVFHGTLRPHSSRPGVRVGQGSWRIVGKNSCTGGTWKTRR